MQINQAPKYFNLWHFLLIIFIYHETLDYVMLSCCRQFCFSAIRVRPLAKRAIDLACSMSV